MTHRLYTYALIILVQVIAISSSMAQQADYNFGDNYVYSNSVSTLLFTQTWGKQTGMNFVNTSTGVLMNNGAVWYTGNFQNDGTVGYDAAISHYPALSYFSGTATQTISGSGTTLFHNVSFQGVSFSLQQDITIDSLVDFDKGIVVSSQTSPQVPQNSVYMLENARCLNASDASFVDGFVYKTGNTAFTFPIGNGAYYRPAAVSAPSAPTDRFSARYIYGDPSAGGYSRTSKAGGVGVVSDKEYWIINRDAGSSSPQVTLTWDASKTSASVPTDLSKVQVVRWSGSQWISEGNVAATGTATQGTVTANVSGYGVFSLATLASKLKAVNDTLDVLQGASVNASVALNDTVSAGPNTWAVSVAPLHGTVSMQPNGTFTYSADLTYVGKDSLTYVLTDASGNSSQAKLFFNVLPLSGYLLVNKHSSVPTLQSDGTFTWNYYITLTNMHTQLIDSIHVEDDLSKVFPSPITFAVTGITATGNLQSNGLYDGVTRTDLLADVSSLAAQSRDSVTISLKVDPHEYVGPVYNQAVFDGTIGSLGYMGNILTDDETNTQSTAARRPTVTHIPVIEVLIPNGFSPNNDGINDAFVIVHSTNITVSLEISTRWGTRVYKNNDYQNDWEGKGTGSLLGSKLLDGTYYYLVTTTNKTTKEVKKYTGFVTLRR